MFVVQKSTMKK